LLLCRTLVFLSGKLYVSEVSLILFRKALCWTNVSRSIILLILLLIHYSQCYCYGHLKKKKLHGLMLISWRSQYVLLVGCSSVMMLTLKTLSPWKSHLNSLLSNEEHFIDCREPESFHYYLYSHFICLVPWEKSDILNDKWGK